MRGSIVTMLLAGGLLTLGACGTLGQPSTFTLAELTERCAARGGHLTPTNRQTGDARQDNMCTGVQVRAVNNNPARSQLSSAIDRQRF